MEQKRNRNNGKQNNLKVRIPVFFRMFIKKEPNASLYKDNPKIWSSKTRTKFI